MKMEIFKVKVEIMYRSGDELFEKYEKYVVAPTVKDALEAFEPLKTEDYITKIISIDVFDDSPIVCRKP